MTDEDILRRHLSSWSHPFIWGTADCFMSVFNYANDLRPCGFDLGIEWRDTYWDEVGALRVLAKAGGGFSGMTRAMRRGGWHIIDEPLRGAPVCVQIGEHQVGGIALGNGFCAHRLAGRGRVDLREKIIGAFWK